MLPNIRNWWQRSDRKVLALRNRKREENRMRNRMGEQKRSWCCIQHRGLRDAELFSAATRQRASKPRRTMARKTGEEATDRAGMERREHRYSILSPRPAVGRQKGEVSIGTRQHRWPLWSRPVRPIKISSSLHMALQLFWRVADMSSLDAATTYIPNSTPSNYYSSST